MFLRQSTIQTIRFGPFLDATDGVTEEDGLTITQALRRLSKDGGDFAQSGTSGNATHDEDGWYFVDLSAADTATLGELILAVQTPATHLPVWMRWWVVEEAVYDDFYVGAGYLRPTTAARTLDVTAAGEAAIDLDNTSGTLVAAQFGADFIDASKVAADVHAETADAVLDEDMTAHQTLGTLGQAIGDPVANTETIYKAVVTDATGANVAADIGEVQSTADDIEIDTIAIGSETTAILVDTANMQPKLGSPATDVSADIAAVKAETASIQAETTPILADTADMQPKLGTPAADVSADIAAVKVDTAAILIDTDALTITGTADSGTTTTLVDAALTEGDTDYWKGMVLLITSGTIAGQARRITDFDAGTDTLTVDTAFTQAVSTNTYAILQTTYVEAPAAGSGDWTSGEKENIRSALGVDGTKTAASAGQLQTIDTVVDGIQTDLDNGTDGLGAIKADTAAVLVDTADMQPKIGTPAADLAADIAAVKVDTAAVLVDTADIQPKIGSPAADLSADIAAVKVDTAAVLVDTGTTIPGTITTLQADTDDIQTRLPASLNGGRMDSDVGAMSADVVTAAAIATDAVTEIRSLVSGTADSGTTTTMVDAARTEADTDYFKGAWILFTSGTIANQIRQITGFTTASDTVTFAPATTQAVGTNTYEILPAAAAADLVADVAAVKADTAAILVDTADMQPKLGAPAGASISVDIAAVQTTADAIETDLSNGTDGLGAIKADTAAVLVDTVAIGGETTAILADTADMQPKLGAPAGASVSADILALKTETASIQAETTPILADTADMQPKIGAPAGASVSADILVIKTETASIQAETTPILADTADMQPKVTTILADTDDLQTRVPASLDSGNMKSSVQNMATDVLTAAALKTDAVDKIRDVILPVKNVAFLNIPVTMVDDTDHFTPKTGLSLGVTRSIDGLAFGAGTGTASEVGNGAYSYDTSAADVNGAIVQFRFTGTNADDVFITLRTGG